MKTIVLLIALAACALAFAAADSAATGPATLVVDRDGVQCGNADFTSIQAAVDAAQPGDLIRVCPDLYAESVTVDKPLTLKGDPDAVKTVDCFQPTTLELPVDQQAIVDPAGDGFSIAFKLEADDVELAGFVVQGASVGIDASDSFSGYRLHHNLIRLNTLFGLDFGGEGTRESRVDHSCIRENRFGLVSELDDDSLWKPSDGPERDEWNARNLRNARIDHNSTYRNRAGLEAAGPGQPHLVTFEHNVLVEDVVGIAIQNSTESAVVDNEITMRDPWPVNGTSATFPFLFGGNSVGLEVRSNRALGGRTGVTFQTTGFIDLFPAASRNVVMAENVVTGMTRTGIGLAPATAAAPSLIDSLLENNTSNENGFHGFIIQSGNHDNLLRANQANENGGNGIYAFAATFSNTFAQNSMHDNGWNPLVVPPVLTNPKVDARDDNWPQNTWTDNDCDTDNQEGLICGGG
jgi:hypothetical protein